MIKEYLGWLVRFSLFGFVGFWRMFLAPLIGAVRGALANADKEMTHYEVRYREFCAELKAMEDSWSNR
jgi:hypothetical protein